MHIKKVLVLTAERIILYIKAQKLVFFLPLVFCALLLPILNLTYYIKCKNYELFIERVIESTLLLIPISASSSIPFLTKDYFEGTGKEILFINSRNNVIIDSAILFTINSIILMLQYAIYYSINRVLIYEVIRVFIASLFFYAITIFMITITNISMIGLAIQILYLAINLIIQRSGEYICVIYYYTTSFNEDMLFGQCIPMLIFGLILISFSVIIKGKTPFGLSP